MAICKAMASAPASLVNEGQISMSQPQPHSYYDNLGLAQDAPSMLIKAARDALLLKYSTENYPDDTEELNRIRNVINASYDVLITPEKRAAHDVWLANSTAKQTFPPVVMPIPAVPDDVKIAKQTESKAALIAVATVGILLVTAVGFIANYSSNDKSDATAPSLPSAKTKQETDSSKSQDSVAPFQPDLAVASINANLRESDSTKSKILRVLPRATSVKKINIQGTFVYVELVDGAKGWIAEELLLPQVDVLRLANTNAKAYIEENAGQARMQESWNAVSPIVTERLTNLLLQLEQRNPAIQNSITLLEFVALDKPKLDASALIWFGQSVLLEKENAKPFDALAASLAAVVAAPYDAGANTALGLAAYEVGDKVSLDRAAMMALGLSPNTTNTWVVMGLSLGTDTATTRYAVGAFMLAIKFSKNAGFTKKYLLELASKATNTGLQLALLDAVNEMNTNPSSFTK